MIGKRKQTTIASGVSFVIGAAVLAMRLWGAQLQSPTAAPTESAVRTAAQNYKNIQVLKDMPADRMVPTMNFIAASLHVDCGYCHVDGAEFEKDDIQAKQTARWMMRMQIALNKGSFSGNNAVTCNTCHRGATTPVPNPALLSDEQITATNSVPQDAGTGAQIVGRYLAADGGAGAWQKIVSFVEKGAVSNTIEGQSYPFEAFEKAPNKRLEIVHRPTGDSVSAFDGQTGWVKGASAANKMSEDARDYFALLAELDLPAQVPQKFAEFRVKGVETIAGRQTYTVAGLRRGQPSVNFYFDRESGLLLRTVVYNETPLGPDPVQVDYSDYRTVGEIKIAFHRKYTQAGFSYSIQFDQFQQNVPIDDAKFTKPM
ncbi:MAG TPA: photosynthetic reaction center cytochrome c subunit family protein [Candidatus Acidoferrales bacterium]|nr:photosynthetic reaction center cytochrome c subunit family protein [Candidatus Acidoferrales bacterium]